MIFLSFSFLFIILKGVRCAKEAIIAAYDKLMNFYPIA